VQHIRDAIYASMQVSRDLNRPRNGLLAIVVTSVCITYFMYIPQICHVYHVEYKRVYSVKHIL